MTNNSNDRAKKVKELMDTTEGVSDEENGLIDESEGEDES